MAHQVEPRNSTLEIRKRLSQEERKELEEQLAKTIAESGFGLRSQGLEERGATLSQEKLDMLLAEAVKRYGFGWRRE